MYMLKTLIKEINWLPISDRVDQFIAVSAYKFFNNQAPIYMENVFKKQSINHSWRFTLESKLHIPLRKHDYGQTVFHIGEQLFGMA